MRGTLKDWGWLIALGAALVVGGVSGYPAFGLDSDDRLYLTTGTLLVALGVLAWRETRYGRG